MTDTTASDVQRPRMTTIRLPHVLHEEVSQFCAARGATINRVVAIALRDYLAAEQQPALFSFADDER